MTSIKNSFCAFLARVKTYTDIKTQTCTFTGSHLSAVTDADDDDAGRYSTITRAICYSNTTVYYGIHECSECIPVDCGVTNLTHDRRSCVDFTLEVEANVA